MDFNLQGRNFIHLKRAFACRNQVRKQLFHVCRFVFIFPFNLFSHIDEDSKRFYPSKADPVSSCEMELDCFAGDILNSLDIQGNLTDPFCLIQCGFIFILIAYKTESK